MEFLKDSAAPKGRLAALRKAYPWLCAYPWQLCRYARREYLCRFREPIDRLIFLLEGKVSISLTPPHGRTHIIVFASTNDLICGDVEVALGSAVASADLRAEEAALCLSLPIAPYRDALRRDNSFLLYALERLSDQMVRESVYTANNLLFPLESRMAAYILSCAENGVFSANLTHTAELLGASYRQLSRVMRGYLKAGLLRKEPGGWFISGRPGLERLAANIEVPI